MLRAMGLVAQWDAMVAELPAGWPEIGLRLRLARPEDAARAAALLGLLSPGVAGDDLHLRVTSHGATGPGVARRLLARLDEEGIGGTLELVGEVTAAAADESVDAPTKPLAAAWDELVAGLPEDWSDLLCLVELRSSDELDPAALALAPVEPVAARRRAGLSLPRRAPLRLRGRTGDGAALSRASRRGGHSRPT